jgi:uncharacterized protein (TIGR02466 family)
MNNSSMVVSPFIDLIYVAELESKAKNKEFFEKALSVRNAHPANNLWRCNTYSSIDTKYNLLEDSMFDGLVKECEAHVKEFAKQYGVLNADAKATAGWINVAGRGAYQEYHIHPATHFSLCYYINTPENCGNIVFKSHEADKNMFPLPTSDVLTHPANVTYWQQAVAGTVVIFRSNLAHMAEINNSDDLRVGVSMNFVLRGQ